MKEVTHKKEVVFPETKEQQVMWGYHRGLHQAANYKAIVNPQTGKLFSIVSKDYRLIRHEEAIEEVEKAIVETQELGRHEINTAFYNDGGRMLRTYRFSERSVEIVRGDLVNPELHLHNSYDTTWPFIVILGAYRLICKNGMVVHEKLFQVKKRHVYELKKLYLKDQVSTALSRFQLQTEQWREWANRELTERTYLQVMNTMKFGKNATEEIENRVAQEADGCNTYGIPIISVWIFFNILTWYITHRSVSLNHRVEMERRLRATLGHLKRS